MSVTEEAGSLEHPSNPRHIDSAPVNAVSLKIPPFWPSDPQIWFAQVEAQFSTRGVTSERTKFDHVVASLAPKYAQEVRDLILSTTPFGTLKTQLIERTAASEQRRLQQLFHAEELCDRKPTQLLRRMQQLLGEHVTVADNSFLRELFLQRLPSNVRMVLASTGTKELQELATLADKIMDVAAPCGVSSVHPSALASDIDQMKSQLADLSRMFESLTSSFKQHTTRSRSRGRSPTPVPTRHTTPGDSSMCWYHERFGIDAKKCRQPCTFSGNDQASH